MVEGLDGRNTDVKDERKIATVAGRVSMYPLLLFTIYARGELVVVGLGGGERTNGWPRGRFRGLWRYAPV